MALVKGEIFHFVNSAIFSNKEWGFDPVLPKFYVGTLFVYLLSRSAHRDVLVVPDVGLVV